MRRASRQPEAPAPRETTEPAGFPDTTSASFADSFHSFTEIRLARVPRPPIVAVHLFSRRGDDFTMHIPHVVLAGLLVFPATRIRAQRADIPRPDTLGANFDHTMQGKGTPTDYDFLVGTWKFRYQARDPVSGNYSPLAVGEWTGTKKFETLFFDEFTINR